LRKNKPGKNKIRIRISNSHLVPFIEELMSNIEGLGLELYDDDKISREQKKVWEKYEKEWKEGKIGGIGSPTPDGFVEVGVYLFSLLFIWSAGNILREANDYLWQKVKEIFFKAKEVGTQSEKTKREAAIITSSKVFEHDLPTILFVLPIDLQKDELKQCLDDIKKLTKKTISDYQSSDKTIAIYKFKYNLKKKKWDLKTEKTSFPN
jgi:hypothetical protein